MRFARAVVSNPHQQQVVGILRDLGGIVLALDLVDGRIDGLVVFQLDNDGGRIDVFAWDEHQVGEALSGSILAVDDVVVGSIVIGDAQHARQRVLVVMGKDAGMLVVGGIHAAGHRLVNIFSIPCTLET